MSAPNKLLAFTDERSAAEQFSAVVHDFSAGQLAQVTRRTKGTAKNWKAGRVFPNGASLINLARNIPEIRAWLYHEIGAEAEFDSPRLADAILNLLNQPEGEALRRALRGAHDRNP